MASVGCKPDSHTGLYSFSEAGRYDVISDSGKGMLVDSSSEGNLFVLLISSTSKISLKQQQAQLCPLATT